MSSSVSAKRYSITLKGIIHASRSIRLPNSHEHAKANPMHLEKDKLSEETCDSDFTKEATFQDNVVAPETLSDYQKEEVDENLKGKNSDYNNSVPSISKHGLAKSLDSCPVQVSSQVNIVNYPPHAPYQFFTNKIHHTSTSRITIPHSKPTFPQHNQCK